MFPSKRNLFSAIPCPELDTCTLSPCLFSHSHSAAPPASRNPTPSTSTSALPSALKRPPPAVPTSAEEFDKRRKLARSISEIGSGSGPSLGGGLSSVGRSTGVGTGAGPGVSGVGAKVNAGSGGRMAGIVPSRTTALVSLSMNDELEGSPTDGECLRCSRTREERRLRDRRELLTPAHFTPPYQLARSCWTHSTISKLALGSF